MSDRRRHRPRRLVCAALWIAASWCLVPTSAAWAQPELTAEQREYDPEIDAQVDKTGQYKLQLKAVPRVLFYQCVATLDPGFDARQVRQEVQTQPWLAPGGEDKSMPKSFSYQVHVPADYDRANPPGLFVFIHSSNRGSPPNQMIEQLHSRNLIVVAANESGNEILVPFRMMFAVYAVELMNRRYAVDDNRVYVSGSSGGGRACCLTMFHWPEVFDGGVPMYGTVPLFNTTLGKDGAIMPAMPVLPSREKMQEAARNGRYAFFTGEKDYNRDECERVPAVMTQQGFAHAATFVAPGVGHGIGQLKGPEILPAIEFVDAPLIKAAIDKYEDAERDLSRDRLGSALVAYEQALPYLKLTDAEEARAMVELAQQQITTLSQQYDQAVAALENAIADQDTRAANEALRELQRGWSDRVGRDALTEYRRQIAELGRSG